MSEAKHTPGPWKWNGSTLEQDVPSNNGTIILGLYDEGSAKIGNPADENLIAAAPDMLAALQTVERALVQDALIAAHGYSDELACLSIVRSAIEKATGNSR